MIISLHVGEEKVASKLFLPVSCLFVLFIFLIFYVEKALKGFTVIRCTCNGCIAYSLPEEQHNSVLLIDVNLSYLPSLASLIFF